MIQIRSLDLQNMIAHCRREFPIEACGILAGTITSTPEGKIKSVRQIYRCQNELHSSTEYKISPEQQFTIFMEIEGSGLDLLGFYHSHPYTTSRPSFIDKERANYYGYSYVIIALHPIDVSSWVLESTRTFKEESLEILPAPGISS